MPTHKCTVMHVIFKGLVKYLKCRFRIEALISQFVQIECQGRVVHLLSLFQTVTFNRSSSQEADNTGPAILQSICIRRYRMISAPASNERRNLAVYWDEISADLRISSHRCARRMCWLGRSSSNTDWLYMATVELELDNSKNRTEIACGKRMDRSWLTNSY